MYPVKGPRQPVSINPNGKSDYAFNPMEDLAVEECAPWEQSIIDDLNNIDYMIEPVYSSQTRGVSSPENAPIS